MRAIKAISSPTQHRMQLLERPIVAAATAKKKDAFH